MRNRNFLIGGGIVLVILAVASFLYFADGDINPMKKGGTEIILRDTAGMAIDTVMVKISGKKGTLDVSVTGFDLVQNWKAPDGTPKSNVDNGKLSQHELLVKIAEIPGISGAEFTSKNSFRVTLDPGVKKRQVKAQILQVLEDWAFHFGPEGPRGPWNH